MKGLDGAHHFERFALRNLEHSNDIFYCNVAASILDPSLLLSWESVYFVMLRLVKIVEMRENQLLDRDTATNCQILVGKLALIFEIMRFETVLSSIHLTKFYA